MIELADKTNFLLYKDNKEAVVNLTDENAGQLFKAIYSWVNGREEYPIEDIGTKAIFEYVFKKHLEKDLIKYKEIVERNKKNGAKGGRPKTQETQSVLEKPKKADNDIDNDIDIVNVIKYLNNKVGSNYKHSTNDTRKLIKARYNEGFTYDDFVTAIDNAYKHWSKTEDYSNMKPKTLFNGQFEGRVNGDAYNWDSTVKTNNQESKEEYERRIFNK